MPDRPRLLLLEPDARLAQRVIELLEGTGDTAAAGAALTLPDSTANPSDGIGPDYRQNPVHSGPTHDHGNPPDARQNPTHDEPPDFSHSPTDESRRCSVITSLAELRALDLASFDIVICASALADGGGLDALAHIRTAKPELAVILTGPDADLAVQAIRGGALDFIVCTHPEALAGLPVAVEKCLALQRIRLENESLQRNLRRSLAELSTTNEQLHAVVMQLESMARTDELTGLANRRWFNHRLEERWADATRQNLPLALMMLDMNAFKLVNDRCGHSRGDELLCLAAKVIRANCRGIDVPARFGGDEFCILMTNTHAGEAAIVGHRIHQALAVALSALPADHPSVSVSIGIAHVDESRPASAKELITHADQAMYAAKRAGEGAVMLRRADGSCSGVNA